MIIIYFFQIGLLPLLGLTLRPKGVSVYDSWWWGIFFWLHFITYLPTATISSLYLIWAGTKNSFSAFLDDSSIWFIVYYTANISLVVHSTGSLLFFIYLVLEYDSAAYWALFLLYVGFSAFS